MTDKEPVERTKINQKQSDPTHPPSISTDMQGKKTPLEIHEESRRLKKDSISFDNSPEKTPNHDISPYIFQNLDNWDFYEQNKLNQYYPHYTSLFEILNHMKFLNNNEDQKVQQNEVRKSQNFSNIFIHCSEGHELLPFLYTFTKLEKIPFHFLDFSRNSGLDFFSNYDQNMEQVLQYFRNFIHHPFLLVISLEIFAFEWNSSSESKNGSSFNATKKRIFTANLNFINAIKKLCPLSTTIVIDCSKTPLPIDLLSNFDMNLNFSLPDAENRRRFLESRLAKYPEGSIETDHLSLQMKNWNFAHIRNYIKYAQHLFQAQQFTQGKKKQSFDGNYLLKLLETNRFYNPINQLNEKSMHQGISGQSNSLNDFQSVQETQNLQKIENQPNLNLESQLYQDAASNHFEELSIAIDKLAKGLILLSHERKLLANYAFLLRDEPNKALQKLNKAKNAIDKILHLI